MVSVSDVPAEVLEKERAIEMEKEDLKSKPEAIRWGAGRSGGQGRGGLVACVSTADLV